MLYEKIYLKEYYPLETEAYLEVMIPHILDFINRKIAPGIIVCPGGGYDVISVREGEPVALQYMNEGYCTFVLHYSTKKAYPLPMMELAYAIDYLRNNSERYYLDPNKISLVGFSAGGHLVSSYGYLYQNDNFLSHIKLSKEKIKPNALIISYAVITMGEYTHIGTRDNITGKDKSMRDFLSVEKNITPSYPPSFIWTTKEDTLVPWINSKLLVDELIKNKVKHEFVLFEHLDHGQSIGTELVCEIKEEEKEYYQELSTWVKKSINFLKKL